MVLYFELEQFLLPTAGSATAVGVDLVGVGFALTDFIHFCSPGVGIGQSKHLISFFPGKRHPQIEILLTANDIVGVVIIGVVTTGNLFHFQLVQFVLLHKANLKPLTHLLSGVLEVVGFQHLRNLYFLLF